MQISREGTEREWELGGSVIMTSYSSTQYLNKLKNRAHADWLSARLLWNLGFLNQPIWLIQQSMEKYLKVLHARDKTFASKKELITFLKDLSKGTFDNMHDVAEIINKLSEPYKSQIGNPSILLVRSEELRYGGSIIYGDKLFTNAEVLAKKIRTMLGESAQKCLFDEIKIVTIAPNASAKKLLHDKLIKDILSLKNQPSRKKVYKKIRRLI